MKNKILLLFLIIAVTTTSLFGMDQSGASKKWHGERYAQNSEIQFRAGMRVIGEIPFKGDEAILDLCCGTAQLAAHMAQNVVPAGHVTAVDFSESMIKKAIEQYGLIPNLKVMQGDATQLNFDEQFDLVISIYGLHWISGIEGIKAVMNGVANSLKSGGQFFALFTIQHSEQYPIPLMKFVKDLISSEKWAPYYKDKMPLGNSLSIDDYQDAMDDAGLTGTASIQPMPARPFNKEEMTGFVSALPILQDLPEEVRGEFLEELFAGFESLKNADGLYVFQNVSGVIKAISY